MITTKSGAQLGFGIELEMGLRPKPETMEILRSEYEFDDSDHGHQSNTGVDMPGPRDENRERIHEFLAGWLRDGGLSATWKKPGEDPDYTKWQIEDDPSVFESSNAEGDKKTCTVPRKMLQIIGANRLCAIDRVEIVSPKLYADWQRDIGMIYGLIEFYFDIVSMKYGSTHIHVAPKDRSWSPSEIKKIAKGIIMMADPLSKAIRSSKRIDDWAKMNRPDVGSSMLDKTTACDSIEDISDLADIVEIMSPEKEFTWNLQPLLEAKGTIEFRRPPQSRTAGAALYWIAVTLSLVVLSLDQEDYAFQGDGSGPTLYDINGSLFLFKDLVFETAKRLGLHEHITQS